MPGDLLQVHRQGAGVEQGRDVLELVARVDPPAAIVADMDGAVVGVDGHHVVGRVGPALDVVEPDRVGRLPVAGVDEHLAAQVLAEIAADLLVEAVHRLGEELELVVQPLLPASLAGLGELPDDVNAHDASGRVVLLHRVAVPGLEGLIERAVLPGEPLAELRRPGSSSCRPLSDWIVQKSRLSSFWSLEDGQRGILGEGDARIRVRSGQQLLQPGLEAFLEAGIEEEQSDRGPLGGPALELPRWRAPSESVADQ